MKNPLPLAFVLLFFLVAGTSGVAQLAVDAGPDRTITCVVTTIDIQPIVSNAVDPVYQWFGPNGFSSNTLNIVVADPGVYSIIVTDQANGSTATDEVTITQDVVPPNVILSVTPFGCGQTGAIIVTPAGGNNLQYNWSNGVTAQNLTNLQPGTYCVTVSDGNNGCTAISCADVTQAPNLIISAGTVNVSCFGGNNGAIQLQVSGGTAPYLYLWTGPGNFSSTVASPFNLQAGIYQVVVADISGCSQAATFVITQPPNQLLLTGGLGCDNNLNVLPVGGIPPFAYSWSGPGGYASTMQNPTIGSFGVYTVTVTDANGCTIVQSFTADVANEPCTKIYGKVVFDDNQDCTADPAEAKLANIFLRAEGANGTFYGLTDSSGQYRIYTVPGSYTVTALSNNPFATVCPNQPVLTLAVQGDSLEQDFTMSGFDPDCPLLKVDLSTGILRRCFSNNFIYVNYANLSPAPAPDAHVILTLDPLLIFQQASIPHTDMGNNEYRFDLDTVGPNATGSFWVRVEVSCDATLGQVHCSEAHIYPDTLCNPVDPLWSGAELQLRSRCDGDSLRFILKNIGNAAMTNQLEYIVIEDGLMHNSGSTAPLAAGDSMVVSVPANGATWRVEAEQEPYLPILSVPVLSIEGCTSTGNFSTGFVEQFPSNDADPWIDVDCRANQGSYDPNDKQGFPIGYGTQHYIKPGTDIEYLIRFQNTGTDTAFRVVILDTLSQYLDPLSLQPGASSHPYRIEVRGAGILLFEFPDIMLPDSNVNEPASNGFVKFRISPRSYTPLETDIYNSAAIYFDFNAPVITNTTQHRIGENFVTVSSWTPREPAYHVVAGPNPVSDRAWLRLENAPETGDYRLSVFDLQGRPVRTLSAGSPAFELDRGALPAGLYLFRIDRNGELMGNGKLVLD